LKLGVEIFPNRGLAEAVGLARRAEELGFATVWVGDSQCLWGELHVTLGAVAASTESIGLGSSVTNLTTRHTSVVAGAWATLGQLPGRRVVLGIGTGDSAVRTLGRRPQTMAHLEAAVAEVRTLLAGGSVRDARSAELYRLEFGTPARVPVYVAASSPRMLQLAGRIADGVIMLPGVEPAAIRAAIAVVAAGAAESGRTLADLEIVLSTPTAISADGATARSLVRTHAARAAMRPLPSGLDDAEIRAYVERIKAQYDYRRHLDSKAAHAELVPDRLVDMFALAGTPRECARQLQRIAESGVDQLAVIPYVAESESRAQLLKSVVELAA
jgi:5,10-methylenetetrahydromethanopterin reductase